MKLKFCYNQDVTNSILGKQVQEGGVPMRKFLILFIVPVMINILFIVPVMINVVSYLIYKLLDWYLNW